MGSSANDIDGAFKPGTHPTDYETGNYVSPEGTPIELRSLPPGSETKPYNVYEVIKPISGLGGRTKPWFGQPGGGIQYKLDLTVKELLIDGFIKRIGQ